MTTNTQPSLTDSSRIPSLLKLKPRIPGGLESRATLQLRMALSLGVAAAVAAGGLYQAYTLAHSFGERMTVVKNTRGETWAGKFKTRTADQTFAKCLFEKRCNPGIARVFSQGYPWPWWGGALALSILIGLTYRNRLTVRLASKPPGLAAWGSAEDIAPYVYDKRGGGILDKRIGYMGQMRPCREGENFEDQKLTLLMAPVNRLCFNSFVLGGIGAGKTRGFFRPLLMHLAVHGASAVVFDLKYPQTNSGFFDLLGLWRAAGRRVQVYAPFSPNTLRLPLLDGIDIFDDALMVAVAIIPKPEHEEERGGYYRDSERSVLAALILGTANHPVQELRNLNEVFRLARLPVKELGDWFNRQENPQIKAELKSLWDMNDSDIAKFLNGLKSKLQIFNNPEVSRATTGMAGENLDLECLFRESSVLYIGIENQYIEDGRGKILLALIKRRLDAAIHRYANAHGGVLPIHLSYVLDEFTNFGRLPNISHQLGTWRSMNVAFHLGVQTDGLGELVYGKTGWAAITSSNTRNKLIFPRGITGEEAEKYARLLGDTTVSTLSVGSSRSKGVAAVFDASARENQTIRTERRKLLAAEEFGTFNDGEAILMGAGKRHIRVWLPAIEDTHITVDTGDRRKAVAPNLIHPLFRALKGDRDLVELAKMALAENMLKGGAPQRKSPHLRETPQGMFYSWFWRVLEAGVGVRHTVWKDPDKAEPRHVFHLNADHMSAADRDLKVLEVFTDLKWITTKTGENSLSVTLTQEGLGMVGQEGFQKLQDMEVVGPLMVWMRQNADQVRDYPGAQAGSKGEESAIYEPEQVLLLLGQLKTLFPHPPQVPMRRVGSRNYHVVPLDPRALRAALDAGAPLEATPDGAGEGQREEPLGADEHGGEQASTSTNLTNIPVPADKNPNADAVPARPTSEEQREGAAVKSPPSENEGRKGRERSKGRAARSDRSSSEKDAPQETLFTETPVIETSTSSTYPSEVDAASVAVGMFNKQRLDGSSGGPEGRQ